MEIRNWLEETTAGQIMQGQVVTLKKGDLLATAAALLLREQVSGAPVVDDTGTCVGVLSASDMLSAEERVAQQRRQVAQSSFFTSNLVLPASVYEEKLAELRDKIAPAAERPVQQFMTTDLVSVHEDTPLVKVVRNMVDAHIHRVVVLDVDQRLRGIISTTDILAALLRQ